MSKITNEIELLFKTKLSKESQQKVGQNLKNLLENAVIGFDEAETKKNLQPIISMIKMMFDKAEMSFDADKLLEMPSRQALQTMADLSVEQLQTAFDRAVAKSGGVKIDFGNVDLSLMTEPLERLMQGLSEIGERVASTTKKSVQDIEKSLQSLNKSKKLDKTVGSIEKTLGAVNSGKSITSATKATTELEKAREVYYQSVTDNDPWEEQYQHLLTFVSKYEAMSKKIKPIVDADRPEFKQLYEILSSKAGAVKISLEHFVDVAKGNELTEYKRQPWARESTLKNIEQSLSNGITVKGGGSNKDSASPSERTKPTVTPVNDNNGAEKEKKLNTKVSVNDSDTSDVDKAAREAIAQKQRIVTQKIEETKKQIEENNKRITEIEKDIAAHKTFKMYKGIGADSADELEDRMAVYDAYGADYYTSDKKAAMSYATDEESHIVIAEIKPSDPLTFDAQKYVESGDYAEVIYSPEFLDDFKARLKEKYAKTVGSKKTLQKKHDDVDALTFDDMESDEAQRVMNEIAYDAGFDSVIFDNVLDYASNAVDSIAEGEGASVRRKKAKTIAVLKDEILKIIGFHKVEETESGQSISKETLTEIPDYYHMPTQEIDDDFVPQTVAEISEDLQEKLNLESKVTEIEKTNKKLQKELDSLKSEVENIKVPTETNEAPHDIPKAEKVVVNGTPIKDSSDVADIQQIEKETESHKENAAAIKEEAKVTEELAAAQEQVANASDSSEELKESQKIISIQKQWLDYLDNILGDDKFKTNGKKTATEQLSRATKALIDYRRHPDEYAGEEMRGDKLVVMWNKAYEEAKRQGVAQSTLTRNYTDAVDMYGDALERLQAQQRFSLQTIAEEEAKINALQQPAQDDAVIHQNNTAAIVAEAQATKALNEEKSKSLLPTADGIEAHTYAPSDEQKEYVLKLGEEYRAIMEILERGDSELESALIERAKAIRNIMFNTVRGSDGFLGHEYENVYGGSHKTATSLEDWRQSDRFLSDPDSNKIDDSQRQAAIDLIYQELEAEKQLEETRRKAREAAKQREIDTFKSKYASAPEEEKKLLYELIELEKEHRTLSDIGDEESHRLALEALQRAREKYIALEKLNEALLDAYDDVGFKRAGPYVDAPRAASQEVDATPVDTLAEQAQLTNLKGSVDDVTGAINTKTQAFKDEGIEVGKVIDGEIEKLGTLEDKISATKDVLAGLINNIETDADSIGAGLSNITVNVHHQNDESAKINTAALADAISKIQVTPDNEGLIAEIKTLIPTLGNLVAQEDTVQAIKVALETKGTPMTDKVPPEIKAETSSKREQRFERLSDVASMYEDVEDMDAAMKEFGSIYKEIVLISEETTKVIKANKMGINTLKKIANETIDPSDYSWVEFKRNEPYTSAAEKLNVGTVSIDENTLRQLLGSIVYNVKITHEDSDKTANKITIDDGVLKSVLQDIVYNVKVASDDNDKQANKIALDEVALENVLKRVTYNVNLTADNEKAENKLVTDKDTADQSGENKQEADKQWRSEISTLLTRIKVHTHNTVRQLRDNVVPKILETKAQDTDPALKSILEQIRNNTAKIGTVPQTPANDSDSILSQISKNVLEINGKIVKGTKAPNKDTTKTPKIPTGRDAQILAERKATQRLSLDKFKTELETSGKMTEDVAKKIRGLAISLGMVKDSKGLTRWGEKFKQQKLGVGIAGVANKESIAEQNANIKEWISLSKQLGELDAKITSGLFDDAVIAQAKQERELVLRRIDEIMPLIKNPDDGFMGAGEANFAGHYDTIEAEKSKRIGKLISQYEKIGQLQARAETSGAFVDREKYEQLSREIQSETEILHLHEAQNAELLEALQARQENAYIGEKDIEYAKEQKRLFTEYVSLVKQIGKLDGIINSDTADAISKQNAQTEKDALMRLVDDIRPRLDLTREDLISAGAANTAGEESSAITLRQKALTDLANLYKKLGTLQAQNARAQIADLQKEIDSRRVALQLTQEEQDVLEEISEEAKQDALNKQSDKDEKKRLADEKKMYQKQAMVGKAGNAVGRAENTLIEALGLASEGKDAIPTEFQKQVENYHIQLEQLRQTQAKLQKMDGPIPDEEQKDLIKQINDVNKLTGEISELVSQYQRLSGTNSTVIGQDILGSDASLDARIQQIKQAVNLATKGQAQIKNISESGEITFLRKTGKNEVTEFTASIRELDHQIVMTQGTTKRTETFIEATTRKMKELTSYFSGMAVFNRIGQELRRGIQYIREIDLALTELRKVTNETEEEYDQFLKTAAKTGARLGTTISAVTEATATFAKLGYSMKESTEMAESAIVYKNVGDNIESTGDAADSIISTMKGFGLEASEAMAIVDRFNEVGNRFAITSRGIGDALRLSASALSEGGNSLDESIALITAANEVVNDPSSVGTALKTLTLRFKIRPPIW